jgi:hypothetical protein
VRHVILAAMVAVLAACGSPAASYPATPAPPPTFSPSVPPAVLPPPSPTEAPAVGSALTASCHARGVAPFVLPDSSCTTGATDPAVTQDNVGTTICDPGYATRIRKTIPSGYTEEVKRTDILEYGYVDRNPMDYELDHLIPLELGGHPTDRHNLWPQPWPEHPRPNRKDVLEGRLRALVCSGDLQLHDAQREIALDWVASYHQRVGP